MQYVYGCKVDKDHPRQEVRHGMTEVVRLACSVCGEEMTRVPQPFMWGRRPFDVLLAGLEQKFEADRYRRSLSK
jgi:hypothetical protein